MKVGVTIKVREEDHAELVQAAKVCGLDLPRYLAEVIECKASTLRIEKAEEAAAGVVA